MWCVLVSLNWPGTGGLLLHHKGHWSSDWFHGQPVFRQPITEDMTLELNTLVDLLKAANMTRIGGYVRMGNSQSSLFITSSAFEGCKCPVYFAKKISVKIPPRLKVHMWLIIK